MEATGQRRAVVIFAMALLVVAGAAVVAISFGNDCEQPEPVPTFPTPAKHLCGDAAAPADKALGEAGEKYLVGKPSLGGRTVTVVAAVYPNGSARLAALEGVFGRAEPFAPQEELSVRRLRDPQSGDTLIYGSAPSSVARVVSGPLAIGTPEFSAPAVMTSTSRPALFAMLVPSANGDAVIALFDSQGGSLASDPPQVAL